MSFSKPLTPTRKRSSLTPASRGLPVVPSAAKYTNVSVTL